jgi:hypothetical protein
MFLGRYILSAPHTYRPGSLAQMVMMALMMLLTLMCKFRIRGCNLFRRKRFLFRRSYSYYSSSLRHKRILSSLRRFRLGWSAQLVLTTMSQSWCKFQMSIGIRFRKRQFRFRCEDISICCLMSETMLLPETIR